ncbi:MAG: aminotransferase class V-fold PLP-dependent enzyme [Bacteroidia bacterium]|nr:aminotransferase class V-fold PLP-dependent enzyme [Bacteroidia bacterium]MCZ2248177.1 aminotransferase class V-fold PLP-dependent enzyme [Bacteroidia bacterium]
MSHSFLENYFKPFRENIIGNSQHFESPYGKKPIIYTDWTASGRLYRPIEEKMMNDFGPFVANTHTETSTTGSIMTLSYLKARKIIKQHVNAGENDCIISYGSGMTGVINKFQRILGLRIPEQHKQNFTIAPEDKPVIFVTHMEHHSNQTSWLETIGDIEWIMPDEEGLVSLKNLEILLEKYKDRKIKYASVTACSNVTGIQTPYFEIAALMHKNGGYCFVDFACSAPYVNINMHPKDPLQYLDAIFFSPHKFLGGPGTTGIMVFNSALYKLSVPESPGGGTVKWTNPWREHNYIDDIETREDGGTPPFLQTIKTALCIRLKEQMGVENILKREEEILHQLIPALKSIEGVHLLAGNIEKRLGVLSFYIEGLHYNLGVKLLNDKFGIQTRGGCSCAGTYGHFLLNVSKEFSKNITCKIDHGDLSEKPGWIRVSIHPTMTDDEVNYIIMAIKETVTHHKVWAQDYVYDNHANEFNHRSIVNHADSIIEKWFELNPTS